MRTSFTVMMVIAGLAIAAPSARAQEHPDMAAAQQELESARAHLKAAGHEYAGHRENALEHVNKALEQIKQGLAAEEHKEKKVEKKEEKAEQKGQKKAGTVERLQEKEKQMEAK